MEWAEAAEEETSPMTLEDSEVSAEVPWEGWEWAAVVAEVEEWARACLR